MIDVEILRGMPEGQLRHWAKVNGYHVSVFDEVYSQWVAANTDTTQETDEPTAEPTAE